MSRKEESSGEAAINVHVEHLFEYKGITWVFEANPLAVEGGITTRLTVGAASKIHPDIMLDWHDILTKHNIARMHMFPGANKTVSFKEKLGRMQTWSLAVELYNTLMLDIENKPLSKSDIEKMLKNCQLPRPQLVVLDTGTVGLRKLFNSLNFKVDPQPPYSFIAKWKNLVELAKSGELIERWKHLKGKS